MKKIYSIVMLLIAVTTVMADKRLYLAPVIWDADGAKFAVYYFASVTDYGWSPLMTKVSDDTYTTTIPDKYENIIFVRLSSSATAGAWNYKWNQSEDLKLTSDVNKYVIYDWGKDKEPSLGFWAGRTEPEDIRTYTKLTSAPVDWSGTYLLVYENSETEAYVFSGVDKGMNYVSYPLSDGDILSTTEIIPAVTIAKIADSDRYSVQINGKYMGGKAEANSIVFADEAIPTTLTFIVPDRVEIDANGLFRFNTKSTINNDIETARRFRYYKSGTAADKDMERVCLYHEKAITYITYYTLAISAGEHGKVNSSVNGKYEEGASVTITATPDEGYEFVGWSDDNTDNPRVIQLTKDITLVASFEKKPEPCMFESLNGLKDEAIREALYEQIKEHTVLDYTAIRADKARVDVDENNHVMDIYSDCVWNIGDYCGSGTDYSECECYNREHIVPQSWWGNDNNQPMRYDLHNVYPTDFVANSNRQNYLYGEVSNVQWTNSLGSEYGTGTPYGSSELIFEPVDQYKGDIARVYFYMSTCYMDKNFTQKGHGYKVFLRDTKAQLSTTTVELLLKWHRMDPVSSKETTRNDKVEAKQGNRNPFVDMPELVEFIWGKRKGQAFSCTLGDVPGDKPGENPGQNEGVEQVVVAPELDWAMPVYNILGQRVGEHYQGVVVQNGYKYLLQ